MNKVQIIISFFSGMILAFAVFMPVSEKSFDVSGISDMERWNDLNNMAARDRFCQSVGYQSGKISENTEFGGTQIGIYAGSPYGYDVYCVRSIEEHQIYDYSQYKKWLVSLEIANTTEK